MIDYESHDETVEALKERVNIETEKILMEQLTALGVEITENAVKNHCRRVIFPQDSKALADYYYNDILLLSVRIRDDGYTGYAIGFYAPNLKEVH
jgi:hypothetical protein